MATDKPEGRKMRVGTGTMGAADHGKTTLAAALTNVLAKKYGGRARNFDSILKSPKENPRGPSVYPSSFDFETERRLYDLSDSPGSSFERNMITSMTNLDGAILVVSASEGVVPQTRKHVSLCRQVGLPSIVVFLNKCDTVDDEQSLKSVESEVRGLLSQSDYPADGIPIVRGSALKALQGDAPWEAKIVELAGHLDENFPDPVSAIDKPFLLAVEDVFSVTGRGTGVTGRIERGSITTGDPVEIIGMREMSKATCTGVDVFRKPVDKGRAGDLCTVFLSDITRDVIERGQVLTAPGKAKTGTSFEAVISLLSKEEGGRQTPIFKGYRPMFYLRTVDVTGSVELLDGVEQVMPGEEAKVLVSLLKAVALEDGLRFTMRDGSKVAGAGVLSKVIE